jgi:hypothetical protein
MISELNFLLNVKISEFSPKYKLDAILKTPNKRFKTTSNIIKFNTLYYSETILCFEMEKQLFLGGNGSVMC